MQHGIMGFSSVDQEYAERHRIVVEEITSGSGDYIVPDGVFQLEVLAVGGGAGAGGVNSASFTVASGGGGSGQERESIISVVPGQRIPYSVGGPGTGGTAAADGTDGGSTTFGSLTALGGKGSFGVNDTNATSPSSGGALRGGGNPVRNTVGALFSGYGGSTSVGIGGLPVATSTNGNAGSGYGAGGSGAAATTGVPRNGGSGVGGYIRIRYRSPDRQRVPKL